MSVQLQDVMDIRAVAVKCMDWAAVYMTAMQLRGVTPGGLFQHDGASTR